MSSKPVPGGGSPGRQNSPWPNVVILPKELRDAIPEYGARALVFDEVSGTPGMQAFAFGPRGRVRLSVHETGKLKGKYELYLDLDAATMRSLGEYLIDLPERAKRERD